MEENPENKNKEITIVSQDSPYHRGESGTFTLTIRSWATPIVGIIMLAIGLLSGYFGRPLVSGTNNVSTYGSDIRNAQETVPTRDVETAAQQQELMDVVVNATRHFRGDPNAPVTIIEFSDFQ